MEAERRKDEEMSRGLRFPIALHPCAPGERTTVDESWPRLPTAAEHASSGDFGGTLDGSRL